MSNGTPVPDPAPVKLTAEETVAQLRAIRERIPEYTQLTIAAAAPLRPIANLDREFKMMAIGTTSLSPVVQQAVGATHEELLGETDAEDRWAVVEDELRAMLKGVETANLGRRQRVGAAALLAYTVSRALVRKPEHAHLVPHVEELKRLKRLGRRKKAEPPPVATTPGQAPPK
jgi:hypothetical protein